MPKAFDAVLFDMDGVLIHSYEAWFHAINATCRHFGTPTLTRDQFNEGWGQGIEKDIACYFPVATREQTLSVWQNTFIGLGDHIQVEPEAPAVIQGLSARSVAHCVVTNTPTGLARSMLAGAALTVKHVVGSSEQARSKPAPDLVLAACERLGVPPSKALMVGDSVYDRDAARAAGAQFVAFGDALPEEPRLQKLTDILTRIDAAPRLVPSPTHEK